MKVLLREDVKNIGYLGDVVEVRDGFARNYLLPNGLAMVPTESNLRSLAKQKAHRAEQRILEQKRLETAAAAVDGAEVTITKKANEQGHLFGSVTANDIAENLRNQGYQVADEVVNLSEHIKQVGTSQITLKFAENLISKVTVIVTSPEQQQSDNDES